MSFHLSVRVRDQSHGVDKAYELRKPYAIIGMVPGADVPLPGETNDGKAAVKPRRIYLQAVSEGVIAVELASHKHPKTGAPAAARLTSEENPVKIGCFAVSAESRNADGDVSLAANALSTSLKLPNRPVEDLWFYFINGHSRTRKNSRRHLRQNITLIGRSRRCHLKISHPDVSEFQCSVARIGDELYIVSLTRRSELRVNGHPVLHSRLSVGDVVSLGPFRMQLQGGVSSQSAPVEEFVKPSAELPPQSHTDDALAVSSQVQQIEDAKKALQDLSSEWDAVQCTSDSDVVSLVEQFASVQQLLMAQSQQQTAMLLHLIGSVQSSQQGQQELLKEQISAIQGVAGELQTWRAELERQAGNAQGQTVQQQPPMPLLPLQLPPNPIVPRDAAPEQPREPKSPKDIQAHASLSERIKFLERERNSLLQKIMRLLPGSNDNAV